jgi:tRNA A-37 threonylcarbamoyl transferase component Bud32
MNNFDKGEVKFYMEQIELAKNMLLEKAYKMAQVKYNGKKGYLHGDIGSENVVVTLKNGRIEDIYFIDFAIVGRPKKLRKNLDDVKYQIEDMFDLLSDLSEESSSSSDSE